MMIYIRSFVFSLAIYIALLYSFSLIMINNHISVTYTDEQSVVKLIQGSIAPSGKKSEKTQDINEQNISKSIQKPSEPEVTPQKTKDFDPFDSINVAKAKDAPKQNPVDANKLESLTKAIEYADKSLTSASDLSANKANLPTKSGNAKASAMPGKYDKYKGMINRKLNEIWQLYRSENENFINLTIQINATGGVEILSYTSVDDAVFMSNVKQFLDKIQKENFGPPPDGVGFTINLLLQTNKRTQGVSIF